MTPNERFMRHYYGASGYVDREKLEQCECVVKNRNENESQRDWLKRVMCMHHWMQTDYYRDKLAKHKANWGMK